MASATLDVGPAFMEEARRGDLDLSQVVNFSKLDLVEPKSKAVSGGVKVSDAGVGDPARVIVVKDGKKMELVSQEYIESLIKSLPQRKPIRTVDHELLNSLTLDSKIVERYRRSAVALFRSIQKARDCEDDILRQYETTGQAFVPYGDDGGHDDELY